MARATGVAGWGGLPTGDLLGQRWATLCGLGPDSGPGSTLVQQLCGGPELSCDVCQVGIRVTMPSLFFVVEGQPLLTRLGKPCSFGPGGSGEPQLLQEASPDSPSGQAPSALKSSLPGGTNYSHRRQFQAVDTDITERRTTDVRQVRLTLGV